MDRSSSTSTRIGALDLGTSSRRYDLLGSAERRLAPASFSQVIGADARDEFAAAVEQYRKQYGRPFPTWSEILEIAQTLGYRKETSTLD